jgi:hypothetical protein
MSGSDNLDIQQLFNFLILIGMVSLLGLHVTRCCDKFKNKENTIYPENVENIHLHTSNQPVMN